jgi:hypothetical protein
MEKKLFSVRSKYFFLMTIIGFIQFLGVKNNPYSNYGVSLAIQKASFYDGPINMGINSVSQIVSGIFKKQFKKETYAVIFCILDMNKIVCY